MEQFPSNIHKKLPNLEYTNCPKLNLFIYNLIVPNTVFHGHSITSHMVSFFWDTLYILFTQDDTISLYCNNLPFISPFYTGCRHTTHQIFWKYFLKIMIIGCPWLFLSFSGTPCYLYIPIFVHPWWHDTFYFPILYRVPPNKSSNFWKYSKMIISLVTGCPDFFSSETFNKKIWYTLYIFSLPVMVWHFL